VKELRETSVVERPKLVLDRQLLAQVDRGFPRLALVKVLEDAHVEGSAPEMEISNERAESGRRWK
jgi:hypothetical protein